MYTEPMISFRFWEDEECIFSTTRDHEIILSEGDTVFLETVVGHGEEMSLTRYEIQKVHTTLQKQGANCMVRKDVYLSPEPHG